MKYCRYFSLVISFSGIEHEDEKYKELCINLSQIVNSEPVTAKPIPALPHTIRHPKYSRQVFGVATAAYRND